MSKPSKKTKLHPGRMEDCPRCAPKTVGLEEAFRRINAKPAKQ